LRYPGAKVLFTSGSVGYGGARAAGADGADLIFRDLGIADDRLVPERASHNTWENAAYIKALAAPRPGQR
jgi:uncharacterized SAM-binding protein YcdF (DUF218 family)